MTPRQGSLAPPSFPLCWLLIPLRPLHGPLHGPAAAAVWPPPQELHCDDAVLSEDPRPSLGLSAAERKAIIARLPGDLRGSSTALTDTLNGASLTQLQVMLMLMLPLPRAPVPWPWSPPPPPFCLPSVPPCADSL